MRPLLILAFTLCSLATASAQNTDPKARANRLKAIQEELLKATNQARQRLAEVQDPTQKRAAQQELTRLLNELKARLAEKALALAEENPKDAVGFAALVDAYADALAGSPTQEQARTLIIEHHEANPKIEDVLPHIAKRGRSYDEELLKNVLEKNPAKTVKATASFLLAQRLKTESDSVKLKDDEIIPKMKEAIAAFEKIAKDYGNMNLKALHGNVIDLAKSEVAAIRKSPIGKPAPDIVGPDTDGRNFRLSDYKGKVVLLDFWGHW